MARQAWRIGEKSVAAGLPVSTETMLALLPEELRAQVLTHFGGTLVGTTVGTNDNAVEAKGSDGAVSR